MSLLANPLSWIYWNPDPDFITLPFLNHPIKWYGVCFVLGFAIGYGVLVYLFKKDNEDLPERFKSKNGPAFSSGWELGAYLTDRMLWFIVGGTIIGARLGHVFFYDWPRYQHHLGDIFKVWEGGLASHGGAIGVMLGLYLYSKGIQRKFPQLTFLVLLDYICIPTALVGCFIRIGNFINQEIVGTPSKLPWAILFGNPAEGNSIVPRHPVQLYESLAYLCLFFFLIVFWKIKRKSVSPGMISGLFFTTLFSARFALEFFKSSQSAMIDESFIQTGQLLSIPFILAGISLIIYANKHSQKCKIKKTPAK